MAYEVVNKLFQSLDELGRAIGLAKRTVEARKNPSPDLLKRISYYEEILLKQRRLAEAMCNYIKQDKWDEVTRHVKLINGLSSLIHEDARELVTQILSGGGRAIRTTAIVA